jgi:Skp family chaperone for outer membrane proteins
VENGKNKNMRQVKDDPIYQQGVLKVTKFKILAAVAAIAIICGVLATDSYGQYPNTQQQQQSQSVHSPVALLDVGKIFKENARFNSLKENLKLEMQRADAELKAKRNSILERAKELKEFGIGTPDYKRLEAQLASEQANLQVEVQLKKKELMMQEAKIYHEVYTEIHQEVEAIAQHYGFVAVLQFSGDKASDDNPEAIMREISKPIVWHNQALDITPHVQQRLNQRSAATANSNSRQGIPQPQR